MFGIVYGMYQLVLLVLCHKLCRICTFTPPLHKLATQIGFLCTYSSINGDVLANIILETYYPAS